MAERTLVEAINDCFHVELERDADVMVMGEDVGRAGGVFRATAGLRDRFGPDRCVDTPLAEAGILGTAVGSAMAGWRPVCEMQYDAFWYPCLDQLITHVGRYRWRSGGGMDFPITVRMPYGGGVRAPELHDDSPETYYVHTPGVKVAIRPRRGREGAPGGGDPRSRIPSSSSSPSSTTGRCAARSRGEHVVPLGKARVAREGTDVTLVAYGSMVPLSSRLPTRSPPRPPSRCSTSAPEAARRGRPARLGGKTGRVVIVQEAPRVAGSAPRSRPSSRRRRSSTSAGPSSA